MSTDAQAIVSLDDVKEAVRKVGAENAIDMEGLESGLQEDMSLSDLGFDSLNVAEIVNELESIAGFPLDYSTLQEPVRLRDLAALKAN